MKKLLLLTVFFLSFFWLGTVDVEACKCSGRPRAVKGIQTCGYYWRADGVFIGHADTVEVDNAKGSMKVTFSVERVIRGTVGKTVEIFTSGSTASCGYPFKQGERYFVYGRKDGNGRYHESLCGPTALLKDADDDLEYARDLEEGKLGTRIFGSVFEDRQPTSLDKRTHEPVSNIEITIKGKKTFKTRTDAKGNFLFKEFPNDNYQVFASLPDGFRELLARSDLPERSAGSCNGEYFRITRQGSIRGRVVGFPSAEIKNPWDPNPAQPRVTLVPLDENGDLLHHYSFEENWAYRDKFEYFFDRVPAGNYLIAINPKNCPYPNNGVPPTYYPGVATQAEARIVTINEGEQLVLNDFRSLPILKERLISGKVVDSSGSPVANARVRLMSGTPGGGPCGSQDFRAQADEFGQFRIKGYETYRYSIQAFTDASTNSPKARSEILTLSQDSLTNELVLRLDISP